MTEQQHPITPSHELIEEWIEQFKREHPYGNPFYIAIQAAQWGADQELEALCELLESRGWHTAVQDIRAARRPTSLKEQGLKSLDNVINCIKSLVPGASVDGEDIKVIRRALEQLND